MKREPYPWESEKRDDRPVIAVGYLRVSSAKQVLEGNGLESQEVRVRGFADVSGYNYAETFKDAAVSGQTRQRVGFNKMLEYLGGLDARKYRLVVIVDDIKRFARDIVWHRELKDELAGVNAQLESPSFKFENNSTGHFMESHMALNAEMERRLNRDQVLNRQRSRLLAGYWPFPTLPLGYELVKKPGEGKVAAPTNDVSAHVKEGLEGFATNALLTQLEFKTFLEGRLGRSFGWSTIRRILNRASFYAGQIEYPAWGVERRPGQHEALISEDLERRILKKLSGKVDRTYHKGFNENFPLKRMVVCPDCSRPYRAYQARGRHGHQYPVYECKTKGCSNRYKSIKSAQLESDYETLLATARPEKKFLKLAELALKSQYGAKVDHLKQEQEALRGNRDKLDSLIDQAAEKLAGSTSPAVERALEKRISDLEDQRAKVEEKLTNLGRLDFDFETAANTFFEYVQNPVTKWKTGGEHDKKLVFRLVFIAPLEYDRQKGFRTPQFSPTYKLLQPKSAHKERYVEMGGIEPPSSEGN